MNMKLNYSKSKQVALILTIVGGLYASYQFVLSAWDRTHCDFAMAADVLAVERKVDEYRQYKLMTDLSDYRSLEISEVDPSVKARYQEIIKRIENELNYIRTRLDR